jgi:hypothetical protein
VSFACGGGGVGAEAGRGDGGGVGHFLELRVGHLLCGQRRLRHRCHVLIRVRIGDVQRVLADKDLREATRWRAMLDTIGGEADRCKVDAVAKGTVATNRLYL